MNRQTSKMTFKTVLLIDEIQASVLYFCVIGMSSLPVVRGSEGAAHRPVRSGLNLVAGDGSSESLVSETQPPFDQFDQNN